MCLHCEISELIKRREAAGEERGVETIARICEVLGDIASALDQHGNKCPAEVFKLARQFLDRTEREIASGAFGRRKTLVIEQTRTRN